MSLISIIVPIYNVDTYLQKCIDSLLNQTYKNIEIILVNDGSTDRSGQICDEYKIKDNRIKVIHKENGGLSDARNNGIDVSKGEYLVFIDSDDWIDNGMIEKLYDLAIKYKADIVQGDYIEAYSENINIPNINDIEVNYYNPQEALELLYSEKCVKTVIACNKLYKKTLFNNIRFPKGKVHEDEFTTYKLLHKSNVVIDTNIPVYYYRQRAGSITNSGFNLKKLDTIEALIERTKYFKINGLNTLAYKTESIICSNLKLYYLNVKKSNIENKNLVLKKIKNEMKSSYISFISNKYIPIRGKITLTMCILNENLFCRIYDRYLVKM